MYKEQGTIINKWKEEKDDSRLYRCGNLFLYMRVLPEKKQKYPKSRHCVLWVMERHSIAFVYEIV